MDGIGEQFNARQKTVRSVSRGLYLSNQISQVALWLPTKSTGTGFKGPYLRPSVWGVAWRPTATLSERFNVSKQPPPLASQEGGV